MSIDEGTVNLSTRLSDDKEENIKHIIKEIYKIMNEIYLKKEKDIYNYIAINSDTIINQKKTILLSIPKINKVIHYSTINELSTGDLLNDTLKIELANDLFIEYECVSIHTFIDNVLAKVLNGRKIKVSIKNDEKNFICKLSPLKKPIFK